MSLLEDLETARDNYIKAKQDLAALIGEQRSLRDKYQEELDLKMVYAADWGGHTYEEVSKAAGYSNGSALRDARKRIEKRETEIW